jgi:hypothetical protein
LFFAVSYSAAALAAHCAQHFHQADVNGEHAHYHDHAHEPAQPANDGSDCAAMAWEQLLSPRPMVNTASAVPAAKPAIFVSEPLHVFILRQEQTRNARPPPEPGRRAYAGLFARTGRLLI